MTINKTTTDLSTLKINYLTQEMYEDALENEEINENELYITPGSGSSGSSAFIAEFNVTTLAEAVTEYNAGKTLVCRYTGIADVVVYAPLIDVTFLNGSAEGFAFSVGGYGNYLDFLLSPNGWTLTEMSATSTPTNNKLPLFDSTAHMNSTDMTSQEVSDFVGNLGYSFNLIDMFYPVGSYYETSDSTFNPNITWGGTWVLETEGQVHVSAGETYEVGDTGGASTVTLTTDEIPAHTHGSKSLTGTFDNRKWGSSGGDGIVGRSGIVTVANASLNANAYGSNGGSSNVVQRVTINATHEHDSVGGGGAHNNMPPYVVVNRWHRTA